MYLTLDVLCERFCKIVCTLRVLQLFNHCWILKERCKCCTGLFVLELISKPVRSTEQIIYRCPELWIRLDTLGEIIKGCGRNAEGAGKAGLFPGREFRENLGVQYLVTTAALNHTVTIRLLDLLRLGSKVLKELVVKRLDLAHPGDLLRQLVVLLNKLGNGLGSLYGNTQPTDAALEA